MSTKDVHLTEFKKELNKKGYNPKRLILFGSRARNDHMQISDYDFLIVSKKFETIPILKRMEQMEFLWKNKRHADFICLTPKEFTSKKKEIGIVRIAVKEGKEF